MGVANPGSIIISVAAAFAIFRLCRRRLRTVLPVLFTFFCYQLVQNLLVAAFRENSRSYQYIYQFTEPFTWALDVLILWELYHLAFKDYPGIASLARWNMYIASSCAVILALWVAASKSSPTQQLSLDNIFTYELYWETCVMFGLTVFIVVMVVLLWRYPIPVDSNLVANLIIFTCFCFASFAFLEVDQQQPGRQDFVFYADLMVNVVSFVSWGIFLKDPAKVKIFRGPPDIHEFEKGQLMQELAAINAMLGKSARN
jgi:hypothetical protein